MNRKLRRSISKLREEHTLLVKNSRRVASYALALDEAGILPTKLANRIRSWCEYQ